MKTCSTLYFGVPYFDQWGIVGGHTSAYRWHINDPIVFNKSIKVTIEHFGWMSEDENPKGEKNSWNERQDDYSSVAFWYQTGTPTFTARAPHARERKLPSLERVTAFGTDFVDAQASRRRQGERAEAVRALSEAADATTRPRSAKNAWVEIPLEVKKKEPLRLVLNSTTAPDYGRYQPYLNGVKLGGPIDFYSDKVANFEYHLLDFWPEPGKYTLRLECVGKTRSPTASASAWRASISASVVRASSSTAATRTRTGRRSRRSIRTDGWFDAFDWK